MTILTTHTGSLPRPAELVAALIDRDEGRAVADFDVRGGTAVASSVEAQRQAGIDIVNDGEQTKSGYSTYVRERLGGFGGDPIIRPPANDLRDHPDFVELKARLTGRPAPAVPSCSAPISYETTDHVRRDIDAVISGATRAGLTDRSKLFLTAASPGLVSLFFGNRFYPTEGEYLAAIADAMRTEYVEIIDAGITLQLDCPDLAMSHNSVFQNLSHEEFRREVALRVEILNYAVRDLPAERMRMHVCWGNYESPHTTDVPIAEILDLVLAARPAGLSIEAANPRHAHEWRVFEGVDLPDGKYLIPGVIDTTTNYVEHPELVAERLSRFASIVGQERLMAGTDCGFNTFIGRDRIAPSVTWSKLRALCEGSRLASAR